MNLRTETTERADHVETDGEVQTVEYDEHRLDVKELDGGATFVGQCGCRRWRYTGSSYEELLQQHDAHRAGKEATQAKLICSCGSYTCGLITAYGLPEPMFRAEIQPIPSQLQRDQRAATLKQTL